MPGFCHPERSEDLASAFPGPRSRSLAALGMTPFLLAACKKETPPRLPGRPRRPARHRGLGPGLRHGPARHHGRGEVQGLGRDPRAQGGDGPAGEARRPAGAGRPAQRRATSSPRPGRSRRRRGTARQRHRPEAAGGRAVQVPVHHRAGTRAGAARLRQRRGRSGARPSGGGQRAESSWTTPTSARPSPAPSSRRTSSAAPSSRRATRNVSGGTTLLKMADLGLVQVRTLVDETDIGKIQPGQRATVTVDAYPNRPFEGTVLKIEPQATTEQNVTMFPVLVRIDNRAGLLRPGHERRGRDPRGRAGGRARRAQRRAPHPAGRRHRRRRCSGSHRRRCSRSSRPRRPARERRRARRRLGGSGGGQVAGGRRTRRSDARVAGSGRRRARPLRSDPACRRPLRRLCEAADGPKPVWIRTGLTDLDYSEVRRRSRGHRIRCSSCRARAWCSRRQDIARADQSRHRGGGLPGMQQQTAPAGAARAPGTR